MKYNITFKRKSGWAIINPIANVHYCFLQWDNAHSYWELMLLCLDGKFHNMPLRAIESITELEPSDENDELVIKLKDLLGNKYKSYENALEKQQNNGGAGIKTD